MKLRVAAGPHLQTREDTRAIMLDVLIALAPTVAAGIYLFGKNAAWVLAVAVASSVISEFIWQKLAKKPVCVGDLSAAVTGLLLGLNLPSTVPLWLPAIGGAFSILLVKQLFGGLGHNFINPALAARAALLTSWPRWMTIYCLPLRILGGTGAAFSADIKTSASVLGEGFDIATLGGNKYLDMFLGNIPGTIGEVCKGALLLGFAYLLFVKVIEWYVPVLLMGTVAVFTWILGGDPLSAVLSGGIMLGSIFMATDYTTTPMLRKGRCIFAVGCGVIVVLIRTYGSYPEGASYAILLMNVVTPLIDRYTHNKIYGEVKQNG